MKIKKNVIRETITGYLFIGPNLLGFIILSLAPILFSLVLCFSKWNMAKGISDLKFIGLDNFISVFKDPWFFDSLKNNLVFTAISVPVSIISALFLAMMINELAFFKKALRTLFFLPYVTNVVAICLVWMMLFQPTYGPINALLRTLGMIDPPAWLASEQWALFVVSLVHIWMFTGYNMVIYLSGIQGIPVELMEASEIDGASGIKKFWYVTLPLLSPTTFFILVTGLINSFKVFAPVNIMTDGGPGTSTSVLVYQIYISAFRYFKMGYASAIAWVLFIIVFIFTYLQWVGQKKWVNYM